MKKIGLYIRSFLAASVTLLLFVITLPLTLFLALMSLMVGAFVMLRFRQQLDKAMRNSSENDVVQKKRYESPPGPTRHSTSAKSAVIDQVRVNGVWQIP